MIRTIIQWPDDRLAKVSDPIEKITPAIMHIARDMLVTMRDSEGIGLSACQIGENIRMITINPKTGSPLQVMVNPEILWMTTEPVVSTEACLSIAHGNLQYNVIRRNQLAFKCMDLEGKIVQFRTQKVLARVLLHEVDHLNGITLAHVGDPIAPNWQPAIINDPAMGSA